VRNSQNLDLFVSYVSDVRGRTKELQDFMSHNWFAMNKGRTKSIEHYLGKDKSQYVKIYTAGSSIANIWDNDFLLFCITQLRRKMEQGDVITSGKLQFSAYDYLNFRYKKLRGSKQISDESQKKRLLKVSGKDYKNLWSSLERLHETHVKTNIKADGVTYTHAFVWLPDIKKVEKNGMSLGVEVQVADWLVKRISEEKQLLTFDEDYFELKGGLERWLYLFCRKACGNQTEWRESIVSLHRKSASTDELKFFKQRLKRIVAKKDLLDYHLSLGEGESKDMLIIRKAKSYVLGADRSKRKTAKEAVEESRQILSKR
jgi:plasmid replication initiation protein